MIALALFAQERRGWWVDALIALMSIAAAMYSWICWLALVPCVVREWRLGRPRASLVLGVLILGVPTSIHFVLTGLASGHLLADLKIFFDHIAERSASRTHRTTTEISYLEIIQIGLKRWLKGIGLIPLAFTAACLVVIGLRRRMPGQGWVLALFAMALPLNLARNIAYLHDFFIILFLPVAAVCAGVGSWWLVTRLEGDRRRALAIVAILGVFLVRDVAPRFKTVRPSRVDYQQAAIARAIGQTVDKDDFVIVNPAVCGSDPESVLALGDPEREQSPRPFFCGQLSQSAGDYFLRSDDCPGWGTGVSGASRIGWS
jgi:hypothetical protein